MMVPGLTWYPILLHDTQDLFIGPPQQGYGVLHHIACKWGSGCRHHPINGLGRSPHLLFT
jgi:hypothetical protein